MEAGKKSIKLVSWNVNGLRAVLKKGFLETFRQMDADVFMIQETKLQKPQVTGEMRSIPGYESHWAFSTVKKGYSGVATYTRIQPELVETGMGGEEFDREGRIIRMDFSDFSLFNVYFPNGQMSEDRLDYKLRFYDSFFKHTEAIRKAGKSIIVCGDFNTAHNEIDLKNPKANQDRSGFLRIERDWLDAIVDKGYADTFRTLYPETVKYSWWAYRFNARKNNAGWRIDYFFVSKDLMDSHKVEDAFIDNEVMGSDHCPVGLILRR